MVVVATGGGGGGGGVGEAQRESIPGESRSTLQPALLLPRAILSSRICDHQHAKWIKFLDYTLRRPFFTRFRFLYLASRHHRRRRRRRRRHRRRRRLPSLSPPASLFVRPVSIRSYSRLFPGTSRLRSTTASLTTYAPFPRIFTSRSLALVDDTNTLTHRPTCPWMIFNRG